MSSCLLFHGPGAKPAALRKAGEVGRLLAPPFGDDGLKADEAREAVSLLISTPVGVEIGVIVIGPMDNAWPKASDVLLKRIEEFQGDLVQPILWAHDLGGVSPTIRSRCLDHWAPCETSGGEEEEELTQTGWELVNAVMAGEYYRISSLVGKVKGREIELLGILSEVLSQGIKDEAHRHLWGRIRQVTRWKNPTMIEIVAALVEDGQ